MDLKQYQNIYFIGIGGIGMSALARWFSHSGYNVAGYDRTRTELTDELEKEGLWIHFEENVETIPDEFKNNRGRTLVVFTPAIPHDHKELNWFKDHGYEIRKRSEILGMISENYFTIAVAGTHGKTTTSSMIAHLLKHCGYNMSGFLGGVSVNYNSNLILHGESSGDARMVVEADEFDRSFLTLHPDMAVLTSTDADHLDIYGDLGAMRETFSSFVQQVKSHLFLSESVGASITVPENIEVHPYGVESVYTRATNIRVKDSRFVFDYESENVNIPDIELRMPGNHNVENAIAAISVGLNIGIGGEEIREAFKTYLGVKRRFEYVIENDKVVFIDDYAHHPTEIQAFISSLRKLYPDKEVSVIFQPHLFTRTRDFAEDFGKSLSIADNVILTDIYPARELPIPGVTAELIFNAIEQPNKQMVNRTQILETVRSNDFEVLATVGAGDIDQLVNPIKEILLKK